jgi:hypothetical protein
MFWCFATISSRIGEIYFERDKNGKAKISGHCFVKKEEFTVKEEIRALESDIKKFKVVYRNKKYKFIV